MTVLSLFQQYGVGSRSKKHKFQTKLDIENFRSILFWSENVDSGVKLDTSNLSNSQSNQNDLTHLIVLLIQFPKIPKSVLSKGPNDCYLEFDKTESQYIFFEFTVVRINIRWISGTEFLINRQTSKLLVPSEPPDG